MFANFKAVNNLAVGNSPKVTGHDANIRAVLPSARRRQRCPYCGSADVWKWETSKLPLIDRIMTWLGFDLLTCRNCRDAFYADERRRNPLKRTGLVVRIRIRSRRAARVLRALSNNHQAA